MPTEYIGQISLNIALVLYLIHYIPQLIHNNRTENRKQLSLHFHGLLSIAYLSDLIFAVGMNMPWQYCLVSVVGVLCLLTQHAQLKSMHGQKAQFISYQFLIGIFVILFVASIYLKLPKPFFLAMGFLCQAAIWIYTLPQIWKNYLYKQGQGLNNLYLGMTLACYFLDVVASTTLNWPVPAKLGAIFGLTCTTVLIYQMYIYKPTMVEQMT